MFRLRRARRRRFARALASNPADGVRLPKPTEADRHLGRALIDAELGALLGAAEKVDPDRAAVVWLLARAGLRIGEALALKRTDPDAGMLRVRASMSRREGAKAPKTRSSNRTIPIPEDLGERLHEHIAGGVASIEGWMFTAPRGGRLRYDNWRTRRWNRIVAIADIGHVTPHDLRHTCATRLFTVDGWTVPEVQKFLGHAKPAVTLEIYTHVADSDLQPPSRVDTLWTPTAYDGGRYQ